MGMFLFGMITILEPQIRRFTAFLVYSIYLYQNLFHSFHGNEEYTEEENGDEDQNQGKYISFL